MQEAGTACLDKVFVIPKSHLLAFYTVMGPVVLELYEYYKLFSRSFFYKDYLEIAKLHLKKLFKKVYPFNIRKKDK